MSALLRAGLLVAVLDFAASSAASCGDDEADPSPTQTSEAATRSATSLSSGTPTAQPGEAAETGGMDGFRLFAAQVEGALQTGDEEFFVQRAETSSLVCPNEFEPRCSGQADGSSVEGVWLAHWQSEGSLLTPEDFRTEVSNYLDSLSAPVLFALATDSRETGSLIGREPPVSWVSGACADCYEEWERWEGS